jgi:glycosyltransferase involved in cell wall biosynthesis
MLTRLVFHTLVAASPRTADGVLTDSWSSLHDLNKFVGYAADKINVIHPGVDFPTEPQLALYRMANAEVLGRFAIRRPYFLYVGAVHRRKNVTRLLEAFERVLETHPQVQLVLAGPALWTVAPATLAARRLAQSVRRLGFVDPETLHVLYSGATATVYPSLYEGFGLPVLEAMAHGSPVIASSTPAVSEAAGNSSILVNPTDAGAFAAAMMQLLSSPNLRAKLSRMGRVRAEMFTWESTAIHTANVYSRLVASG